MRKTKNIKREFQRADNLLLKLVKNEKVKVMITTAIIKVDCIDYLLVNYVFVFSFDVRQGL